MKKCAILLFLFLVNVYFSNLKAQTFFNPVNQSYLPTLNVNTPEWALPLYSPQNMDIAATDKAFEKYYHRDWDSKESDSKEKEIYEPGKHIEFEEGSDSWARYYMLWRPAIEKFIQPNGILLLPEETMYIESNKVIATEPAPDFFLPPANNWTQIGPKETYWLKDDNAAQPQCPWQANIYSIDIFNQNANILVCGTESGHVYKTSNKGVNWRCINTGYNFGAAPEAVACDPQDTSIIYVLAGNYLYKTSNNGTTWTQLPNSGFNLSGNDVAIYPTKNDTLYIAGNNGFFRSLNAGNTWTQIFTNACYDMEFKPSSPNTIYAVRLNGTKVEFCKSTNAGTSFSVITSGWPTGVTDQDHARLAVTSANSSYVYACWLTNLGPYILKSTNSGSSWTTSSISPGGMNNGQGYYDLSIMANPANTNQLIVAASTAYKSTNMNLTTPTWTAIGGYAGSFNIHPDIQEMIATGSDSWIATDGGANYSTDFFTSTSNYFSRTKGIDGTAFWGFDQGWNEDILVGGRYHNGNTAMSEYYPNGYALRMGGAEQATGYVMHGRENSAAFSDLSGGGWMLPYTYNSNSRGRFSMSKYPNEGYPGYANSEIAIHPLYYMTYYLGNGNEIWKSTDGGANYISLFNFGSTVREIEISRSNPNVIYLVTDNNLYKSIDAGVNWNSFAKPAGSSTGYYLDIVSELTDENTLWFLDRGKGGTNTNKIFVTNDGGANWINLTTTTLDGRYYNCMAHPANSNGAVYLFGMPNTIGTGSSGNGYVYYRDNSLTDWTLYNTGMPPGVNPLEAIPFYKKAKLRLCTGDVGRGVWEIPLADTAFYPVAQPSISYQTGYCPRDTFYFEDYSVLKHSGATWSWAFSPTPSYVSSNSVINPKVVFGALGNYTVSLIVTDANGNSDTTTIADMVALNSNQCGYDTIPGSALNIPSGSTASYVSLPSLPLNTNTISFTAWVKISELQPDYSGLFMFDGTATGLNFKQQGSPARNYFAYHWSGNGWSNYPALADSIPTNQWTHVAWVVSANNVSIYMNGKLITNISGANTAVNFATNSFKIGSYQGWTARNCSNILVDESCVYNVALTQNQVREKMHLTKYAGEPNLSLYYQFNETSSTAYDKVALGHGALQNCTRVTSTGPFGGGTFSRISVTTGGLKDFSSTSVKMYFNNSGTYPNGDLVLSRINLYPDQSPDPIYPSPQHYWIVNNYGSNATFTVLDSVRFGNVGEVTSAEAASPSLFKLFKRASFSDGNSWGSIFASATAAVENSTNGSVIFGAGNNITSFSQFSFISQDNPSLTTSTQPVLLKDMIHQVFIYPNPAKQNQQVTIENRSNQSMQVKVHDVKGQLVFQTKITTGARLNKIFSSGMYFYTARIASVISTGKFVVE